MDFVNESHGTHHTDINNRPFFYLSVCNKRTRRFCIVFIHIRYPRCWVRYPAVPTAFAWTTPVFWNRPRAYRWYTPPTVVMSVTIQQVANNAAAACGNLLHHQPPVRYIIILILLLLFSTTNPASSTYTPRTRKHGIKRTRAYRRG